MTVYLVHLGQRLTTLGAPQNYGQRALQLPRRSTSQRLALPMAGCGDWHCHWQALAEPCKDSTDGCRCEPAHRDGLAARATQEQLDVLNFVHGATGCEAVWHLQNNTEMDVDIKLPGSAGCRAAWLLQRCRDPLSLIL